MLMADLASPADDAELRRLMAENPMPGRVTLSFEREPDYFAATRGTTAHTIVIRDTEARRIASFGEITTRHLHVNGRLARVGYLSSWRVGRAWRGQPRMFDLGIERLAELQREIRAEIYYSAIVEDNIPARKRLEARRGLGEFQPLGRLETSLMPVARRGGQELATAGAEAAVLRSENLPQYQFTPEGPAPEAEDFALPGAAAALWDQRREKQTVVRDYERGLGLMRPAWNLLAAMSGRPRLPRKGSMLPLAVLSGLAVLGQDPGVATRLLAAICGAPARRRGLGLVALTLSEAHPLSRAPLPLSPYRWATRLYVVTLPGCMTARDIDPALPAQPEAGFL